MKGAVEAMCALIMIAFMSILGTGYIATQLNTQKAQNYHSSVVANIEASNFATTVINECKTKTISNGYKNLEVTLMTDSIGKPYAKVVLTYNYKIPIINSTMDYSIEGYAR